MAQILIPKGAAPSTPATGYVTAYAKTDGYLYYKDDAGTEHQLIDTAVLDAAITDSRITNLGDVSLSGLTANTVSIPSGAKRITVKFSGISPSTTSTDTYQLKLGDSGGIISTGYLGTSANIPNAAYTSTSNISASFSLGLLGISGSNIMHGLAILEKQVGNVWVCSFRAGLSNTGVSYMCDGSLTMTNPLTQITFGMTTGVSFDAGIMSVSYEL